MNLQQEHRLVFLPILLSVMFLLVSCNGNKIPNSVPNFVEHDLYKTPKPFSVYAFLIIEKNLTREQAFEIVRYYKEKYADYKILNIDMHCDTKYANYAFIKDETLTDNEYYSHVVWEYKFDGSLTKHGSAC